MSASGHMEGANPYQIYNASLRGRVEALYALLDTNVDWTNVSSRTALHAAAQKGHTGCVSALLAAGAPVNVIDCAGETALHAAARGRRLVHADITRLLLANGADISVRNRRGQCALQLARGFARMLLAEHAPPPPPPPPLFAFVEQPDGSSSVAEYREHDSHRSLLAEGDSDGGDTEGEEGLEQLRTPGYSVTSYHAAAESEWATALSAFTEYGWWRSSSQSSRRRSRS